jgi:hypothetical protein
MNTYNIRYYNSGGYKSSGKLVTKFTIQRNELNRLCLFDNELLIGDELAVEALFMESLGYAEEIIVIDAELVES